VPWRPTIAWGFSRLPPLTPVLNNLAGATPRHEARETGGMSELGGLIWFNLVGLVIWWVLFNQTNEQTK